MPRYLSPRLTATGDPLPMDVPAPPTSPDLQEIHKHLLEMYTWHEQMFKTGQQQTSFSQSQLNQMVATNDLTQAGKSFYNIDTQKMNFAVVVGGVLTMEQVTSV